MTNLFDRITAWLEATKNDWCKPIKAHALAASVIALRPDIVVEIGIFRGGSFVPMAMALKEVGKGIAVGIDPWSAQASIEGQIPVNAAWWGNLDYNVIYKDFMAQINQIGLSDAVRIERKKSDDARVPDRIDLLHIDGNHSDQAIRDVERFGTSVRVGGLCFMDDIHWDGGGVERACDRLIKMNFVKLYDLVDGAMFQRIGR